MKALRKVVTTTNSTVVIKDSKRKNKNNKRKVKKIKKIKRKVKRKTRKIIPSTPMGSYTPIGSPFTPQPSRSISPMSRMPSPRSTYPRTPWDDSPPPSRANSPMLRTPSPRTTYPRTPWGVSPLPSLLDQLPGKGNPWAQWRDMYKEGNK